MENRKGLSEAEAMAFMEQVNRQKQRIAAQEAILAEKTQMLEEQAKQLDDQRAERDNNVPVEDENLASSMQRTFETLLAEFSNMRHDLQVLQSRQTAPSDRGSVDRSVIVENRETSDRAQIPTIKYKDALEAVPLFDGYNIPVLRFVRACKRARDLFSSSHEATITQLLRNKLRGHAMTALEDDTYLTFSDFIEKLKTLFGQSKSLNQYRGELGNITKNKSEHIIDYISRIKDLHAAIAELESETYGELTPRARASLENDAVECFVEGLPPTFRLRLKVEGYNGLQEAFAKAIKVEKELERDKIQFRVPEARNTNINRVVSSSPPGANNKIQCEHCNKPHPSDQCWKHFPEKRPQTKTAGATTTKIGEAPQAGASNSTCTYCNKIGHTETVCYKKQNDEKRSKNGVPRAPMTVQGQSEANKNSVKLIECEPSTSG